MTTLAYDRIAAAPLPGQIARTDATDLAGKPGMAHDVFISYSHVDKATADAACATLERAGIRCWIAPRDITPGDEYGAAIVRAIDQCRVIVLIFSASANNSRQIRREVERAVNVGVPLVPVRIENVAPTESLAYFMNAVHWLDALTPPIESHLQELADAVKALLKLGSPGATNPAISTPAGLIDQGRKPAGPSAAPAAASVAAEQEPAKTGMFAELMNFSYQRTKLQALGWYVIFLIIGLAIFLVLGRFVDFIISDPAQAYKVGFAIGQFGAIPYHILLGTLLIWHRKKDAANILLLLGGIVLSTILGALGGLIPLAALTCRPAFEPKRLARVFE